MVTVTKNISIWISAKFFFYHLFQESETLEVSNSALKSEIHSLEAEKKELLELLQGHLPHCAIQSPPACHQNYCSVPTQMPHNQQPTWSSVLGWKWNKMLPDVIYFNVLWMSAGNKWFVLLCFFGCRHRLRANATVTLHLVASLRWWPMKGSIYLTAKQWDEEDGPSREDVWR